MNLIGQHGGLSLSKSASHRTDIDVLSDPPTFWEIVADTTWGAYTSEIAKQAILHGHQLLQEQTVALEMGCEGGRWSKLLTSLGWNMICVDTDQEVLNLCQKRIPAASCVLVKATDEKIPCDDRSIDLLLCMEVAPVIQSQWFITEGFRVLREGGLMVGVFYNLLSLRGLFVRATGNSGYYHHAYPLWKQRLYRQGFQMSYEEGYCWFPFDRFSNSRYVPLCAQLEKRLGLRALTAVSPWIAFVARKTPR